MDKALGNLSTKHYCPKCGSFNLKRVHRGFFKKKLLKAAARYECKGCLTVVSETTLDKNDAKEMPQFIS